MNTIRWISGRVMARTLIVLAVIIAPLAVLAVDVFVGTPPFNPNPGQQVAIELLVDMGGDVLGSYFFTFQYNPAVVAVVSVQGGRTLEFSGAPATDPGTFMSGQTPLAAVQGNPASPGGTVSVARLTLQAVGQAADSSDLDLAVNSLFDGGFAPLPSTVFPSSVLINVPEVATDLNIVNPSTLTWTTSATVAGYNVYRGGLNATGTFVQNHTCFAEDLVAGPLTDPQIPAPGSGFYYLVSGERNLVEGTLGAGSLGQPRPIPFSCNSSLVTVLVQQLDRPVPMETLLAGPLDVRAEAEPALRARPSAGNGDVDNDGWVRRQDVDLVLQAVVGSHALTPSQRDRADADRDGDVDVRDAQAIRGLLDGSIERLPMRRGASADKRSY